MGTGQGEHLKRGKKRRKKSKLVSFRSLSLACFYSVSSGDQKSEINECSGVVSSEDCEEGFLPRPLSLDVIVTSSSFSVSRVAPYIGTRVVFRACPGDVILTRFFCKD